MKKANLFTNWEVRFMGLQLELLPYVYYNTLGFDPSLIDDIDHIDDSFLLDIIDPLYIAK